MTGSHADQLESGIVATVATAEAVLAHFEQSLRAAGFADGANSYAQLADTLIGQRLWSETSGMAHDARFAAVAAQARSIHSILLPYVQTFQRLAALAAPAFLADGDGAHHDDYSPSLDDPLAVRAITAMELAGRELSATALRATLGVPKAALSGVLDQLAADGHIERRSVSGRELIRRVVA